MQRLKKYSEYYKIKKNEYYCIRNLTRNGAEKVLIAVEDSKRKLL